MADTIRSSLGEVQVYTLSVGEINLALQALVERIDELKGLRGAVIIHSRVQGGYPTTNADFVTRQFLVDEGLI